MLSSHLPASPFPRRGVILLVVIVLLTLFAAVGISFVFYADAEAVSARVFREAVGQDRPDRNPEELHQPSWRAGPCLVE